MVLSTLHVEVEDEKHDSTDTRCELCGTHFVGLDDDDSNHTKTTENEVSEHRLEKG